MPAARYKLLGTYRTPAFRYGQRVEDERRGKVRIVGLSPGRIPWPIGLGPGGRSLVLYRDLARAVKRESEGAVCYWWGIGTNTVWKWRQALGVPEKNEGTLARAVAHGKSRAGRKALAAMHAKARDPVRPAKIAAAKLGKPRPAHVLAALRRSHVGKRHSLATRKKMSESHKRRGTLPPWPHPLWAAWEETAILTLARDDAMKATGRTLEAIRYRLRMLRKR